MLSRNVQNEDIVWTFLSAMVEMYRLICATTITKNQTTVLQHYINVHFKLRKECFPEILLRPKHHFISHYPDLIRKLGPLKKYWILPIEQKHGFFKNKAKLCKKFKI